MEEEESMGRGWSGTAQSSSVARRRSCVQVCSIVPRKAFSIVPRKAFSVIPLASHVYHIMAIQRFADL